MAVKRLAIPSKHAQLKVVGPRDAIVVPRIQRLSVTADRPSTDIDELGNRLHAGTVEDIPAITATFQSMDVGIKLFSILTGTDFTNYPASGVSITDLKDVDVIVQIRHELNEDYVKMAHARRCAVRDFTFTYSVDGEATEEYTVVGTKKRWFTNDLVVEKFTTGTTSFVLGETPVALKDGTFVLSVILDGIYQEEVVSATESGQYSVSGSTITTFDTRTEQLIAVYQAVPTGDNWADVNDTDMPAALRGLDQPVLISAAQIDRVQSVTLNGTFNPEAVREMGNRDIVGYQIQIPAVTGTITVLDTDTELMAVLTTGQFLPSGVTEFGVSDFTWPGIPLEVKFQDPDDKEAPYTIIKTVYVPEISVTSEGFTSNVNANAQQTFDIKSATGDIIVYSGAKP